MKSRLQILLACMLAWPAIGATLHVSTTGNDKTGTGTEANPWRTIGRGITGMRGGDTLLIRGGAYDEPQITGIDAVNGLSNEQRTFIGSFPGERAILRTTDAGRNAMTTSPGANIEFVTFSGFTVDQTLAGEGSNLMKFDNPNFITLTNMHFLNSVRGSMTDFNSRATSPGFPGGNIHVVDCLFSNMVNTADQSAASHFVYWGQQTDVLFERNRFVNATVHPDNSRLSPVAIMGGGPLCARWTVRQNYIENTAHGIRVDGADHQFYNNVLVNVRRYSIPVRGRNVFVANNTIVAAAGSGHAGSAQIGIYVSSDDGRDARLLNNIVWGGFSSAPARVVAWAGGTRSTQWINNLLGPGSSNFTVNDIQVGTVNADPLFVNAATDLRLRAGSPAAEIGLDSSDRFTVDHAGRVRGRPWAIGAHTFHVATPDPDPDPDPEPPPPVTKKVPPGLLKIRK